MRASLVATAVLLALTGCGGTANGGESKAGEALSYLPPDAATVVFVSTDVDGDQWEALDRHVYRPAVEGEDAPATLEEAAEKEAKDQGLDWDDDVKPLLGNDVAVAISGQPLDLLGGEGESSMVAALETRDGDVEKVLEALGLRRDGEASGATLYRDEHSEDARVAVEDGVIVYTDDERLLREALRRHDEGGGLDEQKATEPFADMSSEYLVRAFGTLDRLTDAEELKRYASIPLVEALESFALTARFERDELHVDAAVRLDEARIDETDLPLVTGEEAPEIVLRAGEISGGNRNQSQTTVFLLRALRAAHPDSRFVQSVDALERELGIDFEEEILRQFNGPSASYVSPDGRTFAARSEVRDPEALRKVLPRIAPHLPALAEGLQGLQSEGMALLFLFAPDAPAAEPMQGVKVEPPSTPDGLYRISGLTGDGPSELHLGLIGDVFVVASDEQRAREIATAETTAATGAKGAGVVRADLSRLGEELDGIFFLPLDGKELVASLEASTGELRARVRVELD